MKRAKFGDWMKESLLFVGRDPVVWISYTLLVGVMLLIGRVSLALGVFTSVTLLFVGVGIAKYIDLKHSGDSPVGLFWAVRKSLPLAILAGLSIVFSWFCFNLIANLAAGEPDKIGQFFFHWELTPEQLGHKSLRELATWFYTYANVVLIFSLLMLTTFASWFCYPLMLFRNYSFSEARQQGEYKVTLNKGAFYKCLGFVFLQALLCASVIPLLTPVLYMLVSTLMYVSYQSLFAAKVQ